MTKPQLIKTAGVAGLCAVAGAAAGIAGTNAASQPKTPNSRPGGARFWVGHGPRGGALFGDLRPFGGPVVHADAVVPNQAGTGFQTVTTDAGKFKSLSGDQLTITEGTKTVTYKDVTLTIPSGATVFRNGSSAQLGSLQSGDVVRVLQSPQKTLVVAWDAQHQPQFPGRPFRGRLGPRPGGWPPEPPGPPGPPGGPS